MTSGGAFTTTRWTMVTAAGGSGGAHSRSALTELCQIYWPPLYSYLRRRGHDREEAEDLTQGFFVRLLERNDLRGADPARGRFRGFMLTALKRYAINEHERGMAARRGGRLPGLSGRRRRIAQRASGSAAGRRLARIIHAFLRPMA